MKAIPVILIYGEGYQQCEVEKATHVTLRFPGPVGLLTLPVILRGTRDGTNAWSWNGSVDAPTLKPSVKTESMMFRGGDPRDKTNWVPYLCHTFVNDGRAQFLDDTTHELRGQTVDLLDVTISAD